MTTVSKVLLAMALGLSLTATGCTDAERSSMFNYGETAYIKCYSGGQVIFEDESTGKVLQLDGDGITYKSAKSGKYVRAFADCIVTN